MKQALLLAAGIACSSMAMANSERPFLSSVSNASTGVVEYFSDPRWVSLDGWIRENAERRTREEQAMKSGGGQTAIPVRVTGQIVPKKEAPVSVPMKVAAPTGKKLSPIGGWWVPAEGLMSRNFSKDTGNIEIMGSPESEVSALASGKIVFAGNGPGNYGLTVIIQHDNDLMSAYANLGALLVKEGDVVLTAQEIGSMGVRGDRAYTIFELREKGQKVNPIGKVFAAK